MTKSGKILIALVVLSFVGALTFFIAAGYVKHQAENRFLSQINRSSLVKTQSVEISFLLRKVQLIDVEIQHPRIHLFIPTLEIAFPHGISEMISTLKSQLLNDLSLKISMDRMDVKRIEITKRRVLENLKGDLHASVQIQGKSLRLDIADFNIDEYFDSSFQMALETEELNLNLQNVRQAPKILTERIKLNWPNYALVGAKGALANKGLSQLVLDTIELPQGQMNEMMETALLLFEAVDGNQLTAGELIAKQSLSSAKTFFNSREKISFKIEPPDQKILFKDIISNLQNQIDLGVTELGLSIL